MPIYPDNKTNYPPFAKGRNSSYTYFFLNGKIHATYIWNKGADTLTAWCFPDEKMYQYSYSDVSKRMDRAFDLIQVTKILRRNKESILQAWREGGLELVGQKIHWKPGRGKWKFSEEDVMKMLKYFSQKQSGPRKRGNPTTQKYIKPYKNLPSPAEARAMMRYNDLQYIKNKDGEFVPVYGELKFDR